MTINEIINLQKKFDFTHSNGDIAWDELIDEYNISSLEHLLVCALGELGETANIVKKISRGDYSLNEQRDNLEFEITDLFIYVLKLIYQLDIDIEKKYLEKMKINTERFKNYEREHARNSD